MQAGLAEVGRGALAMILLRSACENIRVCECECIYGLCGWCEVTVRLNVGVSVCAHMCVCVEVHECVDV